MKYCYPEWDEDISQWIDGECNIDEWFSQWDMTDFSIVPLGKYPVCMVEQEYEPSSEKYYQEVRNVKLKELEI